MVALTRNLPVAMFCTGGVLLSSTGSITSSSEAVLTNISCPDSFYSFSECIATVATDSECTSHKYDVVIQCYSAGEYMVQISEGD